MRVSWLEPVGVEVEEGDYEDSEQKGAVDTRSVEDVGGGDEEDEIDRRRVGAVVTVREDDSCQRST
jgi:hypothetical protein